MTETQIMEKLRQLVSDEDPQLLYSKVKKIGQGCVNSFLFIISAFVVHFEKNSASGSVYVAKTLTTGKMVALKEMDLSHQPRKELIVNEIMVMKESQHPNIVNLLESYLVENRQLWVIMEYMEGSALTGIIDNNCLEEDQISCICLEVCTFFSSYGLFGGPLTCGDRLARALDTCTVNQLFIAISKPTMSFLILKAA
jgi:serine/threonine-protein kinase CLA4